MAPGAPEDETGIHGPTDRSEVTGEIPRYPDGPYGASGDGLVQIAYCHGSRVSHSWHNSMVNMLVYDQTMGMGLIESAPFQVACSGPHGLVEGRNLAVQHFLDETPHEWLFWIDTDMGFEVDALDRLFMAADVDSRPVVGGLCFALKQIGSDGFSGHRVAPLPTLFGIVKDKDGKVGFVTRTRYKPNTVMQVAGTGSAFILIHRSVLEEIRRKHGDEWYELVSYEDRRTISEDLSFCWRVADAGFPIFVHTGVKTTHHKEIYLGEADYSMPATDPVFKELP